TQPPAPDLQRQIRPSECGEHPTQLDGVEMQVALNRRTRSIDVDPVNVGEPIHQADHEKHEVRRRKNSLEKAARVGGGSEPGIGSGHGRKFYQERTGWAM